MDMQALLAEIELDMQELKYLTEAYTRESNENLRGVLRRNIVQMRSRLQEMLQLVDATAQIRENNAREAELTVKTEQKPETEQIPETKQKLQTEQKPETEQAFETEQKVETEQRLETKEEKVKENAEILIVSSPILGERIKPTDDLRRSVSLNDSFRFSREIFEGDSGLMNRVLEQISAMNSLETALAYLSSKVSVDEENEATADFLELLKKHFN